MVIQIKCESVDVMEKGQFLDLYSYQEIKALIKSVIGLLMSLEKVVNNEPLSLIKHTIHYHFIHTANNANHVINSHTCYQYIMSNQCVYDNNGRDHWTQMFINNNGDS